MTIFEDVHRCEIEIEEQGMTCGKPAAYQSMFAYHLAEKRYLWVCERHGEELRRCAESVPTRSGISADQHHS